MFMSLLLRGPYGSVISIAMRVGFAVLMGFFAGDVSLLRGPDGSVFSIAMAVVFAVLMSKRYGPGCLNSFIPAQTR